MQDPIAEIEAAAQQGWQAYNQGQGHLALQHWQRAYDLAQEHLPPDHPLLLRTTTSLGSLYYTLEDYAAAEPLFLQEIELHQQRVVQAVIDLAAQLHKTGRLYFAASLPEQAGSYYQQALEQLASVEAETSHVAGEVHHARALLYESLGRIQESAAAYQQTLDIRRTLDPPPNENLARLLQEIGRFYADAGRYPEGAAYTSQAVEMFAAASGLVSPAYASALYNLGVLYSRLGRTAEAQSSLEQALEIQRSLPDDGEWNTVRTVNQLVSIYKFQGGLDEARQMLENNVQALDNAPQPPYPLLPITLSHLGNLYMDIGDYAASEQAYTRVAEITRQVAGEASLDHARSLSNLGNLRSSQGDLRAAELLYRQALDIRRKQLPPAHPDLIDSLIELAELYRATANPALARRLLEEARQIAQQAGLQQAALYADLLNYLALVYVDQQDDPAALPLFQEALAVYETSQGGRDLASGKVLGNLGELYRRKGDYAAARSYTQQALDIHQALFGESHPLVSIGLNNLALVFSDSGDDAQAEECYRRSLAIKRKWMGAEHASAAIVLVNLASVRARQGDEAQALEYLDQGLQIGDRMIGQVFNLASERQRMAYVKAYLGDFFALLSLVIQHRLDDPAAVCLAADWILRRKALGAEAMAAQRDAVLGQRAPALLPVVEALQSLRGRIATRSLQGPGEEGPAAYQAVLAEWQAEQERLEAELARQIPAMDIAPGLRAVDHASLCAALPAGSALLEFVRHYPFNFQAQEARGEKRWQPPHYLAAVLLAGQPEATRLIDLGEAQTIDRLVQDFCRWFGSAETQREFLAVTEAQEAAQEAPLEAAGQRLRAAVFDPLLPSLQGCTRLFISPDGDLARLPFEALPTAEKGCLVNDYRLSYVSAGRDVLRFGRSTGEQAGPPVVVADPDFDLSSPNHPVRSPTTDGSPVTGGSPAASGPPATPGSPATNGTPATDGLPMTNGTPANDGLPTPIGSRATPSSPPGARSQELQRGGLQFSRLPGTHAEGTQVAARLGVQPWLEAQALEARLRSCRSPYILHLATHGFFLRDQEQLRQPPARLEAAVQARPDPLAPPPGGLELENPLLRSGLALAGANTWLKNGPLPLEAEDGLLTAEDVTGMDLLDTELVVLSACETGLGRIETGEGVFGLRRAFVLAGAKTLVMSLWKVPDQQTQELMDLFYQGLGAGLGRAEALRQAQLGLQQHYPNPRYWGAFICQGEPGPLPLKP